MTYILPTQKDAASNLGRFTIVQFDAFQQNLAQWRALQQSAQHRRPTHRASRQPIDSRHTAMRFVVELSNTLTSAMAYVESRKADTSRAFGTDSPERENVEQILRHAFDSSFAFRLCWKLRNVLVHAGLVPISLTERLNQDGIPEYAVTATPDALLAASNAWGRPVTRDLQSMTDAIDIVAVIDELAATLASVEESCIRLHLAKAKEAATRLLEHIKRQRLQDRYAVCVVSFKNPEGGKVNLAGLGSVSPGDLERLIAMQPEELVLTSASTLAAPLLKMSREAAAILQANLAGDQQDLNHAVSQCLSDPVAASNAILTLTNIAAVSLLQVQHILGVPALDQLNRIMVADGPADGDPASDVTP